MLAKFCRLFGRLNEEEVELVVFTVRDSAPEKREDVCLLSSQEIYSQNYQPIGVLVTVGVVPSVV